METCPDRHGIVRSAVVRTATGNLHRPVTCLCLLEDTETLQDEQTEASCDTGRLQNEQTEARGDNGNRKQERSENNGDATSPKDNQRKPPVRTSRAKRPGHLADYV